MKYVKAVFHTNDPLVYNRIPQARCFDFWLLTFSFDEEP